MYKQQTHAHISHRHNTLPYCTNANSIDDKCSDISIMMRVLRCMFADQLYFNKPNVTAMNGKMSNNEKRCASVEGPEGFISACVDRENEHGDDITSHHITRHDTT